ncbi:MAG: MFS transporter [Bacillota bacterium]|nr:MFS transporter [Bacillota bacterium]
MSKVGSGRKHSYAFIMITYLLGIFMGAIDTGIVTPARTIIQNNLMVDEKTGIWMITIYTLAYAASIPIMGKLADKRGRKYIYLISIFLFGFGSLLCGLSQNFKSFEFLLVARVVQAIGGGGIVPIATAEFGTTFPKEKRGMALGLVGGVYGVANIIGSSAGSAILDIFGNNRWQFIFYVNVPITLFILIAGLICLPNTKSEDVRKIDIWGISVLTIMILSVMYGLRNIDFFNFKMTFFSTSVYPFLIIFILLLPLFILAEKKADDPVINLTYFKNPRILITLFLGFLTGIIIMGMVFVPQFSENAMKITTGNGGYFVLILGLFSGVGAPVSGRLIDKFGVKIVLGFGFLVSMIGSLFLILVTASHPSFVTVFIGLMLVGIGIGFTMGTPLNYMMLDNTRIEESNSALATLSLIRSIGTAIAPAIMVGFISHAGMSVQTNLMNMLPSEVSMPQLPYAQELNDTLTKLKNDPNMKDKLAGVEIPDFSSLQKVEINMNSNSDFTMSEDLSNLLKASDVTTITSNCKTLAGEMFKTTTPSIIAKIQNGIDGGITAMRSSMSDLDINIEKMQSGYDGIGQGIDGMEKAIASQKNALKQIESLESMMAAMPQAAPKTFSAPVDVMTGKTPSFSILALIPESVKSNIPKNVLDQLSGVKSAADLDAKKSELESAIKSLQTKVEENKSKQQQMKAAINSMTAAKSQMSDTINKMTELKNAIPSGFETAKTIYMREIDNRRGALEGEFQKTMNGGFKQLYLTVTIASAVGLLFLALYRKKKNEVIE